MMKISLSMIMVFFSTIIFAQSPIQIKGTLNQSAVRTVKLFKVVDGSMKEIANSVPQADKKFGFTFYPEYEGFYALGTGEATTKTSNLTFYFKSGDQLDLTINDLGYDLVGQSNSRENIILAKWHKESVVVEDKSFNWMRKVSTFVDFFPELELLSQRAASFAKDNKSGNVNFDRQLATYIKWDLAANATNFLNTPRSAHPAVDEYIDYYNTISLADFSKDAAIVYGMPWGARTLENVSAVTRRIKSIPYVQGLAGLDMELSRLANDTLKGDRVLGYMEREQEYTALQEAKNKYENLFLTESQKQRATSIMNDRAQIKPGDQGLNFAFPDHLDKMVRFNDLKGKVVLIDVWATWCGPCKAEIPHLKKLEEEMKDTDLEVVSISVDVAKDKEKWKKMIVDEKLGGLQLFASGWGDFCNYYKIKGIPRFMVFDKTGKIVTVEAPRPSDPKLKELLIKVLASK